VLGLSANATECYEDSQGTIIPVSLLSEYRACSFEQYVKEKYSSECRTWDGIHINVPKYIENGRAIPTTVSISKLDEHRFCSELRIFAQVEGAMLEEVHRNPISPKRNISTFPIASIILSDNIVPFFHFRPRHISVMSIGVVAKILRLPTLGGIPDLPEYRCNLKRLSGHWCGKSILSET
jgi:hypothetical protein